MTTSFAHFVRGQFVQSAEANVAGFLWAVVCAVSIPWAGGMAVTGKSYYSAYPVSKILAWILGMVLLAASIQWGFRLWG